MRVPPHDLVTERAILACVLMSNIALDEVLDVLQPSDFYSRQHALLFAAMLELHKRNEPIDLVTLRARLSDSGEIDRAGGDDALSTLLDHVPIVESLEAYARRVAGLSRVRAMIAAAHAVAAAGYGALEDLDAYLVESEAAISSAAHMRVTSEGPVAMKDAVVETMDALAHPSEKHKPLRIRFANLQRMLGGGLSPTHLVLIAGRPSMGKTAIGLNIAISLADSGPGIFYSLEMNRDELVRRALASEGRVDGSRMRLQRLVRDDWSRLASTAEWLAQRHVDIDHTPQASLAHIRSTARRKRARDGLAWIVVDYLQLMGLPGQAHREQEIGDVSRGLKALAKELEIPVLALAQLNRDLEKRPIKERRPQLSDLRDSGSLEQDADVVAFVYREEVYMRDDPELRGKAELIIRKQRSGPTGTIRMRYFHEYTRFEEFAEDEDDAACEPEPQQAMRYASGGFTRSVDPEDFRDW